MCHPQDPWMCSSLLQQSHECAIVAMSDLLMNFLQPIRDFFFSQTRSDLLRQVALVAACQHRDQCPSLMVQRPNQPEFPNRKRRDRVVAHRHRDAPVPKCQRGMITVFHEKLLRQRLTQRLRKLQWKRVEMIRRSAVFVSFITRSMSQDSLNVGRSGQDLPRLIQWTSFARCGNPMRSRRLPSTSFLSCRATNSGSNWPRVVQNGRGNQILEISLPEHVHLKHVVDTN